MENRTTIAFPIEVRASLPSASSLRCAVRASLSRSLAAASPLSKPSSKTLKQSLMGTLSGHPSFRRRRSHLDSASYRTLSRIFAVCRDLSHKSQNPHHHAVVSSGADELRTSDASKSENPKVNQEIGCVPLVVEKIDSVEHQNAIPNATIISAAVENQTSDVGRFEKTKWKETTEALQLVLDNIDPLESENRNCDATLCSVTDKDCTSDPGRFDNPQLDETIDNFKLGAKKIDSMGSQKPNPDAMPSSVIDEDQIFDPGNIENMTLDETVEALQLAVANMDSINEVEIDVSNNSERLNSMVSDLSLLVVGPVDHIQSGSCDFASEGQMKDEKDHNVRLVSKLINEKDQNLQVEVDNIFAKQMEAGNDIVLDLGCQERVSDDKIVELGEWERLKDDPYKEMLQAELVRNRELLLENAEGIRLEDKVSNLENSNQNPLNDSIEEGEITDDAQDLDDESDSDRKGEPLIDDETEKDLADTGSDEKLSTKEYIPGSEHDKAASQNQGIDPHEKANEVRKKRKSVMTAERKAKKKKLYRISRAKKLREAGVKRLRLPPPVKKEKEKKICKYYLHGKCQQGGQCKFSHDVIPVTKSKACNHFARGECLKGDECPYDHELSKYPCHKFVSEGICTRGDNCKFSHNVQSTQGTSVQAKEAVKEMTESNMRNEANKIQNSLLAKCTPAGTIKHLNTGSVKSLEAPLEVPKGIRFLSFGADKKQEKHGIVNPITKEKPHLMEQNVVKLPYKERKVAASKVAGVSGTGELSEAAKMLQEFLFERALPATI